MRVRTVWTDARGNPVMSPVMPPVWRDAEGNVYDSWDQLELDHLKNVVVLLTKRAEEAQKAWRLDKNLRRNLEMVFTEARWRELLLSLEGATSVLKKRLGGDIEWKLDPPPKTPQEVLVNAEKFLPKKRRNADFTTGKIIERPRKLQIRIKEEET